MEKTMRSGVLMAAAAFLILNCGGLIETPLAFATEQACTSEKAWITGVRHRSKGYSVEVLSELRGIPAEALVSNLNADPPVTNFTADHVMIVGAHLIASSEPVEYVLLALFQRGCLVRWSRADPRLIARLLAGEFT
jgi:hypothetical protein